MRFGSTFRPSTASDLEGAPSPRQAPYSVSDFLELVETNPAGGCVACLTGKVQTVAVMSERSSWATTPATRRVMQANRSRDTKPELVIRRILHKQGLRYRVNVRPLQEVRRTADIVFRPAKVAVFVDGCFWNGCTTHKGLPKSNTEFWRAKIEANVLRDRETNIALNRRGCLVVRVWEHENPETAARLIVEVVRERFGIGPENGRRSTSKARPTRFA